MATQAVLIADTIAGMKRAVARSRESVLSSDSEDSIDQFTNRGNKLKRKARYVHEGQLDRPNGPKVYKRQNIEHAGYHRDIISQNPHRYDEDGEELEDDEEDEEADAAAAQANPYDGILLHVSAADLPTHPSLSVAFKSPILSNMLQDACEMVQRERNTIRGAKQLLTKLRGDQTWIPCSSFDSDIDNVIFDTTKVYEEIVRSRPTSTLAKNKHGSPTNGTPAEPAKNGEVKITLNERYVSPRSQDRSDCAALLQARTNTSDESLESIPLSATASDPGKNQGQPNDTDDKMDDGTTVRHDFEIQKVTSSGTNAVIIAIDNIAPGASPSNPMDNGRPNTEATDPKEMSPDHGAVANQQKASEQPTNDDTLNENNSAVQADPVAPSVEEKEDISMLEREPSATNDDLQPIAHRMRTRAQAQAVSEKPTSMRTRSPSVASSFIPSIHPLFLIPDGACADRDFGLPPEEAEATRRILMSYAQKQEEVCRGAEALYNGLLRAERMKKDVFDSCKAEGHVGEMSDGEDWYDKEEWGLEEDLRKGHDEEEDEAGTQHKKTRGRRA
ncbi:MAG: hypothetical protein Q9208_000995 [Pyrenodesmia sp. 3 TL-2023]